MSRSQRRYFKTTHPVAGLFKVLVFTGALSMLIPVFAFAALALNDRPGFLLSFFREREGLGLLWVCLSPMALVVLGLGGLGIHRGVFVDSEPRTLTVYWGWKLPWAGAWVWRRVESRSPRVWAPLELHCRDPEGTTPVYSLVLPEGREPLVLFSQLDYPDTRDKAERMARLLDLSLRDLSPTVLDVAETEAPDPSRHTGPRTASLSEGEARVVQLPSARPSGRNRLLFTTVLLSTGVAAGLWALMGWSGGLKTTVWLLLSVFLLSVVLPALMLVLRYAYWSSLSHVIRGSRDGLVVESTSIFGCRVRRFARAHVRQVSILHGVYEHADLKKKLSRLLLRGDHFEFTLGAHLPRAELQERARELRAALGMEEGAAEVPRRSNSR